MEKTLRCLVFFGICVCYTCNAQNKILDSLKPLLIKGSEDSVKVNWLLLYGSMYRNISTDTMYVYFRKALGISHKLDDKKWLANSYVWLTNYFMTYTNYKDSTYYYGTKSLQVAKEINYWRSVGLTYNDFGYFYSIIEPDNKKALAYFDSSIVVNRKIGNVELVFESMIRRLEILTCKPCVGSDSLKASSGIAELKREIRTTKGWVPSLTVKTALANYALMQGQKDSAITIIKEALLEAKVKKNIIWETYLYGVVGDFYSKAKRFKEGIAYADTGLKLAIKYNLIKERMDNYRSLVEIYKNKGDYKGAFDYFTIAKAFDDSIKDLTSSRSEANYNEQLLSEKNKQDMILLKKDKELEQANVHQQRTFTFFALGALVLVVVFSIFMFNRFRITQRQKKVIEAQKQLVEDKQKEILDSIHYAKRIQRSLQPTERYIEKSLDKLQKG